MRSLVPWHLRLALVVVAVLLLVCLSVLLTWLPSLANAIGAGPVLGSYALSAGTVGTTPGQIAVQLQLSDIDEIRGVVSLRVSAHRDCAAACAELQRISLYGLQPGYPKTRGFPDSGTLVLQPGERDGQQTIQLPLSGHAMLYPFDTHELWLALGLAEADGAGVLRPLTPAQAEDDLFVAVRADVPRFLMEAPLPVDAATIAADPPQAATVREQDGYLSIHVLRLRRSRWLQLMAVLLVLLIAMASGYAACMRSVPDLVMGAGGLVLGVWSIRAMLVPSSISYATIVDITLSLVITFLLSALSVRVLLYLCEQNGIRLGKRPADTPPPSKGSDRLVDDLERLTTLQAAGALTDEEVRAAKHKLLS